jgi:hypothetical protein
LVEPYKPFVLALFSIWIVSRLSILSSTIVQGRTGSSNNK